tara:strand:- start:21953 stop:22438 length:486 start_codon:yes stop_codon:yes gene_type:complete
MRKINYIFSAIILCLVLVSSVNLEGETKLKCLIQMKNYSGEGAYIIISLTDKNGNYIKTLNVQGDDPEWYHEITSWWKFHGKKRSNIDGITGETLSGGERSINIISIDKSKFISDYRLRFETAVEDKNYFEKDLEINLDEINSETKYSGKGFIRYVRILKN